jgi:integrase/recombinase XerD
MNLLRSSLHEYLDMRHELGYKLRFASGALEAFISFMEQRGESHITAKLAMEWAQLRRNLKPVECSRRIGAVRGFARYRSATDPLTEVPPCGLLPYRARRARPYIYSDQEIRLLLESARLLQPADGLRPWTYYCLFGLLSVTGLRISELLSLQRSDVDLDAHMLTIRCSKFSKSRLVPLHASTNEVLTDYAERRDRLLGKMSSDHFLVSDRGRPLQQSTVRRTFYDLSRGIGLRRGSDNHGPRLHDFRHRFAVTTLLSWYRSGEDIERHLPVLSTYLGHTHVTGTYWYLSLCPELMGLSVARLERRLEGQP